MDNLIDQMNSFDAAERNEALIKAVENDTAAIATNDYVNMHMHTFFSFNGESWSPGRLIWEARQQGLHAVAGCDFDVLDGMDEFLAAARIAKVRAAMGFESRTFFSEYADKEINSPGEPGVFYFMGMGFVRTPAEGSEGAAIMKDMIGRAHTRNRDLIDRINAKLNGFALDYEKDVLPLTPANNATERHMLRAIYDKSAAQFGAETGAYWAKELGLDSAQEATFADANKFMELLRAKLMKKGGVGYVQPTKDTFPLLDDVIKMILSARAIPMSAWLDGSTAGESNPLEQLECLAAKGIEAVNIIPDRNWNFADAAVAETKIKELNRYVEAAVKLDMPINVGTEMNKKGQRFIDDFEAAAMKPHHQLFLDGANAMVGQTTLLQYADLSMTDAKAENEFSGKAERNEFFSKVGALPAVSVELHDKMLDMGAEKAYAYIKDSVAEGNWR